MTTAKRNQAWPFSWRHDQIGIGISSGWRGNRLCVQPELRQKPKIEIPAFIFSQKTNIAAHTATPKTTGDRRNNQITVTGNPKKKIRNCSGYSALHAPTKMLTLLTSIHACTESEISRSEIAWPLLVTALGTRQNNRNIAKTRPGVPKSISFRYLVGSISKSRGNSELGC